MPKPAEPVSPTELKGPNAYDPIACKKYLDRLAVGPLPGTLRRRDDFSDTKSSWTRVEHFVWDQLCNGLPARAGDMATHDGRAEEPPEPNSIRGELIRAVFDSNQFDAPGFDRIVIDGFRITSKVELTKTRINNFISLRNSVFQELNDFRYVSTEHNLDLTNSEFQKGISLRGFRSTQSVFFDPLLDNNLDEGTDERAPPQKIHAKFIDVSMSHVNGVLAIGNMAGDRIDASGASFGQLFRIYQSDWDELSLQDVSAGSVEILGTRVRSPADDAGPGCAFQLNGIDVRDSMRLDRSDFGCLSIASARIGGDLWLRGITLASMYLAGSNVIGDLVFGPARWSSVDERTGQSTPHYRPINWIGDTRQRLNLSQAQVNAIRAPINRWLDFRKDSPVGATEIPKSCAGPPADRSIDAADGYSVTKFITPLISAPDVVAGYLAGVDYRSERNRPGPESAQVIAAGFKFRTFAAPYDCYAGDKVLTGDVFGNSDSAEQFRVDLQNYFFPKIDYSPLEFDTVESLFRNNGRPEEASEIGVFRDQVELRQHWKNLLHGNFLEGLKGAFGAVTGLFIGYGYHIENAVVWALILVLLGWAFFRQLDRETEPGTNPDVKIEAGWSTRDVSALSYSFDMLLPIVRLREKHYKIDIVRPFVRRYFYLHKLLGYVIGIYILAGLSGLAHNV